MTTNENANHSYTYDVLVDPGTEIQLIMQPTEDRSLKVQMVGRVSRPSPEADTLLDIEISES
jgi:hypothetical protein